MSLAWCLTYLWLFSVVLCVYYYQSNIYLDVFFFFSFSHFDHIELHIQTESKLVREIFGLCYTTIPQQLENENILDSANGATATDWKGKMRKSAIGRAGPAAGPESWDGKLARTGGVLVWPEACRNGEPRLNRPIIERVKGWRGSSSGFCGPEPVTYRYTDNDVWRSGWNRRSFVVDTLKYSRKTRGIISFSPK